MGVWVCCVGVCGRVYVRGSENGMEDESGEGMDVWVCSKGTFNFSLHIPYCVTFFFT